MDERGKLAARAYEAYEKTLRRTGALDFDDLLLRAGEVLRRFEEARRTWQQRFPYVHVDEYQDTNRVQYDLLRLLVGERPNLCVVGDEDQSIYRWRGADVGNILSFSKDFADARVFRIEQNYRSRQKILDAAAAVVSKNARRIGKVLSATRGEGSNLVFYEARDARGEAEYVCDRISELQREDSSTHCAVMYRTNAQSRALEEVFRARAIRYRLLGGFSFYQRAEIRDAFSYVRLAIFPEDDIALIARPEHAAEGHRESHGRSASATRSRSEYFSLGRSRRYDHFRHGARRGPAAQFPRLDRAIAGENADAAAGTIHRLCSGSDWILGHAAPARLSGRPGAHR